MCLCVGAGERRSAAQTVFLSVNGILFSECVAEVPEQPSRLQLRRRCGTAWKVTPVRDGSMGFFHCVFSEN